MTGAEPTAVADTMRDRFVSTTTHLLDEDSRAGLVLAEISTSQFARAMRRHPERALSVGIREQLMIGVAAGMALAGMRPIVHTYAPFLVQRPFEQLKLDLGHQGLGAVLVSVGASHDWAAGGRTHHAPEDVALLDTLPGWTIHVPGHPAEVDALLRSAVADNDLVYIRLADRSNATAYPTKAGLQLVRQGRGAVVVAVGPMLDPTLDAVEGLDVSVVYASTARPLDPARLLRRLQAEDLILVEPYLEGTSLAVALEALGPGRHRILTLGVPRSERRRYGTSEEHDEAVGLHPEGLRSRIVRFLGESRI